MPFKVILKTKRLFRKPIIETIKGMWINEEDIRHQMHIYRPKAKILSITPIESYYTSDNYKSYIEHKQT